MHLCLSSAHSEQYRRDILRALAMPKGSRLQFRYGVQHVYGTPPEPRALATGPTIIAYLDKEPHRATGHPTIVPVRFAKLVSVQSAGSVLILQLELEEFCSVADLGAFNVQAHSHDTQRGPQQQDDKIIGQFVLDIEPGQTVERSHDLLAFEATVTELAARKDFSDEKVFYHVQRLKSGTGQHVNTSAGEFQLPANNTYTMEIYHFHSSSAGDARLLVQSGMASISVFSNPTLYIGSRYDLKTVEFRVSNPPPLQGELPSLALAEPKDEERPRSILSVFREVDVNDKPVRSWDFDLPVVVIPATGKVTKFGAILGLSFAVPSIITILSNQSTSPAVKGISAVLAALAGVYVGVLAAHGLRKPSP